MAKRLILVMNGLQAQGGQDLSQALALAAAGQEHGLCPVLATHALCPPEMIPGDLSFFPIFTSDHWHGGHPAPALFGIRGDIQALVQSSPEQVYRGRQAVRDLIHAYFAQPQEEPLSVDQPTLEYRNRIRQRIKALLPPLLVPLLRCGYRYCRRPHGLRAMLRLCLPPAVQARLRPFFRLQPEDPGRNGEGIPGIDPHGDADLAELAQCLEAIGDREDLQWCLDFQRDLERLLCLVGVSSHDHVFLALAHCRELVAVQRIVARMGPEHAPQFHLRFHGSIAHPQLPWIRPATEEELADFRYQKTQQAYLRWVNQRGNPGRICLYAASSALAEEYRLFTDLAVDPLPVESPSGPLLPGPVGPRTWLRVVCLGGDCEEKVFQLLPDLIDALSVDFLRRQKVRFWVQVQGDRSDGSPSVCQARQRLASYPSMLVRVVRASASRDHFRLLAAADMVLLPDGRARAHGVMARLLAEAIAAGKTTIVPAATTLALQQPPGTGLTFTDLASLATAIRKLTTDFATYEEKARFHAAKNPSITAAEVVARLCERRLGAGKQAA